MDGFLIQRPSRLQTLGAGTFALLTLAALAATAPNANLTLPAIGPFLPMSALTVFSTSLIAAFLLGAQFTIMRRPVLGTLAGTYAFVATTAALQLLAYPGVFSTTGLLGARRYSAAWIWMLWHGGFPLLVVLAMLTRYRLAKRLDRTRHVGLWLAALAGAPVAAGIALGFVALYVDLPKPFTPSLDNTLPAANPAAIAVWAINLGAIVAAPFIGRMRTMLDIWLVVVLLACFADTSLNLLSTARFSAGWYVARLFGMFTPGILVCVLVWEVTMLYRRLYDAHASLVRTASHDALTMVYNRSYFNEQFERAFDYVRRHNLPIALVMVDVDHFKQYNDTFGHLQGDTCLAAVAAALSGVASRAADFVARYGGEEFAVVLPGTDERGAAAIAEQARQSVERLRIAADTSPGYVTVSAGYAATSGNPFETPGALVAAADAALYRAKMLGRNMSAAPHLDAPDTATHR
ncbi:sensor domain-containing diguanylate cyclase [Burkholderia thailandensis]|uniref:diguanylate cyclase n=1 Tax=Burkholderia thailandensis (strain ATCC 700388 / DSM 13276 / CCUG 48851 / CIP 106301 / E264) TaxID=271848 RepID=Q2T8T9_BURTA|nr:sensor domain-containing diguanylate cyclase [Burkholderia thailandensis]ABC34169.1 GGDEF domain protein [Burkholderia thailandensis E264]AHI75707.1 diguanylate cyclase domain protein [Burkholderia thailandensis 2002721723]AHI82437.1 diguanylate cyclase domain protein [Burkholderia thailandensis E444]AIC89933.1 diguanylate cyclase domain protein [Burkholderia thailandensis USAMRU Malaysia \